MLCSAQELACNRRPYFHVKIVTVHAIHELQKNQIVMSPMQQLVQVSFMDHQHQVFTSSKWVQFVSIMLKRKHYDLRNKIFCKLKQTDFYNRSVKIQSILQFFFYT